jgi:hypothetical protein
MTATILALAAPDRTLAQVGPRLIGAPGPSDQMKSERQRKLVDELSRRNLGTPVYGREKRDLDTLQRLLDDGFVRRDDVFAQQSLGLVLGDIMVANMKLEWVVVDDDFGHSRALRYRGSDQLFFPITMIPKRLKAGERIRMRALYALVEDRVRILDERP